MKQSGDNQQKKVTHAFRTKDILEFIFHKIKTFFLNLFKDKTTSYTLMRSILNGIKYHIYIYIYIYEEKMK